MKYSLSLFADCFNMALEKLADGKNAKLSNQISGEIINEKVLSSHIIGRDFIRFFFRGFGPEQSGFFKEKRSRRAGESGDGSEEKKSGGPKADCDGAETASQKSGGKACDSPKGQSETHNQRG